MKKIKEVLVVEGKNDTKNLKQYFDCDTIETNGTHLGKEVLMRIKKEKERRGIIIFTDPDTPGNTIRNKINEEIPGCLNAFVNKKNARTEKKVGIEHASQEALEEALENLVSFEQSKGTLTTNDLYELGLLGSDNAKEKREQISEKLHLGTCGAKTFLKRINHLGWDRKQFEEELHDKTN